MRKLLLGLLCLLFIAAALFASPQDVQRIRHRVWLPSNETGLKIWLQGDDAVTGTVTTWNDASGNGNNGTGIGTPTGVASVLNTHKIVRFGGIADQDYFTFADVLSSLTAAHILVVVKVDNDPPARGTDSGLWRLGTDTLDTHYPFTDSNIYDGAGSTARKAAGNPTPSLASWRLYDVISTSSEWTANVDNAQFYTTGTNTVGLPTAPRLGTTNALPEDAWLAGDIAEFLIYDHKLGAPAKANLVRYLNAKYGLSIP